MRESLLFDAIKQHDDNVFEALISDPQINLNAQEPLNGNTPLMMAVAHRYLKGVEKLVQAGADVNKTDFNGQTALIKAVIWNDPAYVRALITTQTDLNTQDNMGNTASIYAVMAHSYEIQALLSREAKKRHIALKKEVQRHLRHADGNAFADREEKQDIQNNADLFHKIADIKEQAQQVKADMSILFKKWMDLVDEQNVEAINYLIKNNIIDIDLQDSKGETALFKVMVAGNERLSSMLLELGASPDVQNNQGITPLMVASALKNVQMVKQGLMHSKNIHLQNHKGKTALDFAMGDKEITALFQEKIRENLMRTPISSSPAIIENQSLAGGHNYRTGAQSER